MALAPPPLGPSLSLSDIMHPMSPPPREPPPPSPAAEILQEHDIAQIRARALQMGLSNEEGTEATPRERELFDMVLRLTNPNLPSSDPSQLLRQADTIAGLVHQREYLMRCVEEERSRWESEKESWDRISEALIIQRNRHVNGPEDSELRRMCRNLEYDNNALKIKVDHTQGRINALEAELFKLKPHILMQPFVPRPTMISPDSPTPPAPATAPTPPPVDMEVEASENVPPPSPPPPQESNAEPKDATAVAEQPSPPPPVLQPPTLHALAQASSYFTSLPFPSLQNVTTAINRKKQVAAQLKKALHASAAPSSATQSDAAFPAPPPGARTVLNAAQAQTPPARKSSRKSRRAPPQLIVSDARAEHLLIAARRLGRERAGIVAGVISAERERMERLKVERERDRIEKEKERIEREKKNRGGGGYYRERPEPGSSTAAVSETPPTREATRERASSHRYAAAMAGYVSAAGAPAKSEGKGKGKGVPTPLDSLLNAARSMLDNGQDENGAEPPPSASTSSTGTGMMTRRRAANANESASTSAPKRRRLSSPARARTALDVLADQAAVFSNSGAPGKGKGKYSMAEDLAASVVPLVAKRKRGRPPKATPVPMLSKNSRLISPALVVAGPSHQDAVVAHDAGSTNASTSAGANGSGIGIHPRPATKWVQRGRLTSSASSRPPPRQKDDMESEDEEEEGDDEPTAGADEPTATVETEKIAEPELEGDTLEPVVRPTAVATPRPAVDEVPLARQDDTATETAPQPSQLPPPPVPEDPVLDADADGESDPDVDMDGPDATTQSAP